MKKITMKTIALALGVSALLAAMTGCGAKDTAPAASAPATEESGVVSLAGSTSMEKLCEAMSESFMEAHPNITVTVEYTGSGAGLEALSAGSVDIGNSSRALKDGELQAGCV